MRFVWFGFVSGILGASLAAAPCDGAPTAAWNAAAALERAPAPPGTALVVSTGGSQDEIRRLEDAGFRVAVAVPPRLYYVRTDGSSGATLPSGLAFARTAPAATVAADPVSDPFQGREDVLRGAWSRGTRSNTQTLRSGTLQGTPFGARWTDTSEIMIGRVALEILFPESDGTVDPDKYDWTPALRDSVVRAAVRAAARWNTFAARRGVPLTFALETRAGLATRYEPIEHTVSDEGTWIQDVLTPITGYKADAMTLAYDLANAARARLGAQWGVILFAVRNDHADSTFADGNISHAILGGPYFVTPLNNLNTLSATLDFYIEHELAHSFWALDEHFPSTGWWDCRLTTGYLNQLNTNSVVPGFSTCHSRGCVMYANQPDSLCPYTQNQVGWADLTGNGIPDFMEQHTGVFPDSAIYRTGAGQTVVLRGRATVATLPNVNPWEYGVRDTITLGTVDSVFYKLDGEAPISAVPMDGAFDTAEERFAVTLPPLGLGDHLVEWQAVNSNGIFDAHAATTQVSIHATASPAGSGAGVGGSSAPSLRLGPTPSAGSVRFHLTGAPGEAARATIFDVRGRLVFDRTIAIGPSGDTDWLWDGRAPQGALLSSGLYFVRVELDGVILQRRLVLSR